MLEGVRRQREKKAHQAHHDGAAAEAAPRGDREVIGILHVKPEGYGFVSPLSGGARADDLFLPPHDTRQALDGDVVRVRPIQKHKGRRAGKLIEIVEQRHHMLIGAYHLRGKLAIIEPRDHTGCALHRLAAETGATVRGAAVLVAADRRAEGRSASGDRHRPAGARVGQYLDTADR